MRINIVHPGTGQLKYEIREIVEFARKIQATGVNITWENIGDPIAKGEEVPEWIRQIISDEVLHSNASYGYSPTKGLQEARDYISATRSHETGSDLRPENILFFNGLGDAISKVYTWLNPVARVLGPNPAYPTHSSIEGAHGRSPHLTYSHDPNQGWLPDMQDIRNRVRYNPNIAALLLINPGNPTGVVFPRHIIQEFVDIAREYNLFLISDEIYARLAFDQENYVSVASLADGVPTIIMRGLSKEVPWPGGRCGWLEFYNTDADMQFARYAEAIEEAKMNEVCSTTLPQAVLPKILSDGRYPEHLARRREKYHARAQMASRLFNESPYFNVIEPGGAFYMSVTLTEKFLQERPRMHAQNEQAEMLVQEEFANEPNMKLDKQFCLLLLAATGVCTVPLSSGFNSTDLGFRLTLLEEDEATFEQTIKLITNALHGS